MNEMEKRAGFERLWIWKEAAHLSIEIFNICKNLPREERFKLVDQIQRSSSSVNDNIAEGYTSYYYNDKLKCMNVARKEAGETQNHIKMMEMKKYLSDETARQFIGRYEKLIIGINSFRRYIIKKRDCKYQPGSTLIL